MRRRGAVGLTAAALLFIATAGAAAHATTPRPDPLVSVAQGAGTTPLAAGLPLGDTDPATALQLSFVLRARNLAELEAEAQAGWQGHYLNTAQFAARYGQSRAVISAIEHFLHQYGIRTFAYADGLDISATGTTAEFNRALAVTLHNYRVKQAAAGGSGRASWTTVHGSLRDPRLPAKYARTILSILGLSNYAPYASNAVRASHTAQSTSGDSLPPGTLGPQDFAKRYHLDPLYQAGATGQGTTLGIITLAKFDPSAALRFWNRYLGLHESRSRITVVPLDGGAPGPSLEAGTDETDLDVEQSGALAPKAKIRVYEAPNTDPGFADAFFAAASDNLADAVSVSWGESETVIQAAINAGVETPAFLAVFDEAFLEYAAQGQSSFASSGDEGAYIATGDLGTTNLSVDVPASSPYITAAGGTTLPGLQTYQVFDATGKPTGVTQSANIPTERAWSWDYLWPLYGVLGADSEADDFTSALGGSGGGYSATEPRPTYQQGSSAYNYREFLIPTQPKQVAPGLSEPTAFDLNPAPALRAGQAKQGRGLPDVSANADPQTGYAVYDPTLFPGGFAQYGGTSFVAPQLNGSTAVIVSALGHRVGFWNPSVYAFAHRASSPFTELNDTRTYSGKRYLFQTNADGTVTALPGEFTNDNLYYTGKPGTRWNPAVGLGTPNLTTLAKDFAGQH